MFSSDGVADTTNYVDDVFSTYTYTGIGSNLSISTNINTLNNNSLLWFVNRGDGTSYVIDNITNTPGNVTKYLKTSALDQQTVAASNILDFTNTGFDLKSTLANSLFGEYVAWTFRKKTDFFDIVTYTGNGTSQAIPHNLNSVPGFIIVKALNANSDWVVYHSSLGSSQRLFLNQTDKPSTNLTTWNGTNPTSSNFYVGSFGSVNTSGVNYIAYVFGNNSNSDGIIKCGSYTGSTTISLGWEPQWLLIKNTTGIGKDWYVIDSMRGLLQVVDSTATTLSPNNQTNETPKTACYITPDGFVSTGADFATDTYIYVAIRKSNKPPVSANDVYMPLTYTGASAPNRQIINFTPDTVITSVRNVSGFSSNIDDRFNLGYRKTSSDGSDSLTSVIEFDRSNRIVFSATSSTSNSSGNSHVMQAFKRSVGFFDTVRYSGTGIAKYVPHTLAAKPQLIIVKGSNTTQWVVYTEPTTATKVFKLVTGAAAVTSSGYWDNTEPTATNFRVGTDAQTNKSGTEFFAYLFASVPGISKVFSYTGNGTSQTIDCGFTTGARFILIKRADASGDWYFWDSARGIVSGTDPHISLNTTAVEVTTADSIDPDTTGFIVNQVAATNINVSAGIYIGLAIA